MLSMNASRAPERSSDPQSAATTLGGRAQWLLVDDEFVVLDLEGSREAPLDDSAVGRPLGTWLHTDDLRCSPRALCREGRAATLRFRDPAGGWVPRRVHVDRLDAAPRSVPGAAWLVVVDPGDTTEGVLELDDAGATVIDVTDRLGRPAGAAPPVSS
ncbi:MAG: hypothetical protein D6683_10855 [Actinomyces sp.]|nr:MAG: hypothetical protein D6683_10855 [Actinomyces sp.]